MTNAGRLAELERTIESGLRGDVAAGEALEEINGERLYRETHASFDAYCRERWGFAANYAYRLIDAARAARVLPVGNTSMPGERVLREISPLVKRDPDLAREVWAGLVGAHGDALTAAHVRYEVRPLLAPEEPEVPDAGGGPEPFGPEEAEPFDDTDENLPAPEGTPPAPPPTPASRRRPTPAREGGVRTPVFPYAGSKWRLAPRIVEMFPPHRVYIEPFLGSAAVFLTKGVSEREILNDVHREVVNAFEVVRARPGELAEEVSLTLNARDEFEAAREALEGGGWGDRDELERARMWFVMAYQGHRRQARGQTYRRSAHPEAPDLAGLWRRVPGRLAPVAARLKDAVIENRDAAALVREHRAYADALVYADPPYVLGSLRSGELYEHSMTDEEHEELLEALREHPGPVFLSGYDSDLYRAALPGWEVVEMTEADGEAVELLWLNGPAREGARAAERRARERERKARAQGRISAPSRTPEPPEEAALFGALLEGWRTAP